MKRLSSSKAKKILEFLVQKRLKVKEAILVFKPYFNYGPTDLCVAYVTITCNDNKGHDYPIICQHGIENTADFSLSSVQQWGYSFAKLLRWMESRVKRGYSFGIANTVVFSKGDTVESALVEMDLCN